MLALGADLGCPNRASDSTMWQRQFYRFRLALLRFVLYQAATTRLLVAGLSFRHDGANSMLWFTFGVRCR
jgi:hypothetical protein